MLVNFDSNRNERRLHNGALEIQIRGTLAHEGIGFLNKYIFFALLWREFTKLERWKRYTQSPSTRVYIFSSDNKTHFPLFSQIFIPIQLDVRYWSRRTENRNWGGRSTCCCLVRIKRKRTRRPSCLGRATSEMCHFRIWSAAELKLQHTQKKTEKRQIRNATGGQNG